MSSNIDYLSQAINKPMVGINLDICARLYNRIKWKRSKYATICSRQKSNSQGILKFAVNFDMVLPTKVGLMMLEFKASDYPDDDEKKMIQPKLEELVLLRHVRHTNSSFGLTIQSSSSKFGKNCLHLALSGVYYLS